MLSDSEQRRLAEIESWLRYDDPAFARRFAGRSRRTPAERRRLAVAGLVLAIAVIATTLAAIFAGAPAAILAATTVGAVTAGLYLSRRRHIPPTARS
jgi:Protein of unknown function (DUF3040)